MATHPVFVDSPISMFAFGRMEHTEKARTE